MRTKLNAKKPRTREIISNMLPEKPFFRLCHFERIGSAIEGIPETIQRTLKIKLTVPSVSKRKQNEMMDRMLKNSEISVMGDIFLIMRTTSLNW